VFHLALVALMLAAPVAASAAPAKKAKAGQVAPKGGKKSVKKAAPKSAVKAKPTKGKATTSKAVGKGPKLKNAKPEAAKKAVVKKTKKKPEPVATADEDIKQPASPDADLDESFAEEESTTSGPWLVVFVLFVIGCVAYFVRKHRQSTGAGRENFHANSTHEQAFSTNMKSLDLDKSGHQTNQPQGLGAKLKGFFGNRGPGSAAPSAFGDQDDITEVSGFSSQPASSLTKTKPPKSRAG
jgi:hypothetical protein